MKKELTDKEWELIQAIRNYHKAYPNGEKALIWYIERLLEELLDRK
ncbi:MAG: hypothetical protein LBQ84_04390 [Flavobacteriaceae bacterium]|jgi:hypothetical protein|nr:hypothetical protein [Flavobacteriaceae bacterium]